MCIHKPSRTRDWRRVMAALFRVIAGLQIVGICGAAAAFQLNSSVPRPGLKKIKHIVFIVKENRGFDHYFGTFPGANGATSGLISTGQTMPLWHAADIAPHDLDHTFEGTLGAIDGGKMDRFDLITGGNVNGDFFSYTQMTQADIPNYWTYAQNFVLGDAMFASMASASYSNHLYTIAAGSGGAYTIPTLNSQVNPKSWGCDADPNTIVKLIRRSGRHLFGFPLFRSGNASRRFNAKQISWKSYAPSEGHAGYVYSVFDSIDQIRNSSEWTTNVVPNAQFITV